MCSAHATPGDLFDLNIISVVSYIIPLFFDCLLYTLLGPVGKVGLKTTEELVWVHSEWRSHEV